jgi:two-component system cell cycle response regulator DivK
MACAGYLGVGRNGINGPMTKTVLIVEDNDLNMKLFNDLLEVHGYKTVQSKTGREALEIARERHPDLILMDIQFPKTSGLDVTRSLKGDPALRDIPVVAVSAYTLKGDEDQIREGGCDGFIAKPISVKGFLKTIADFIG